MRAELKISKKLLFHLNLYGHSETNPKLMRILLTSLYTKVDFGYTTNGNYINGGWTKISKDTFIEVKKSNKRYKMINTFGIPISPKKHKFKSTKDWQYYSLYFEPIPHNDCVLNIIETENGTPNDFNYYNIELKMADAIEVV